MDRLEINGPTMHLWFFAYVTLDLKVLKKQKVEAKNTTTKAFENLLRKPMNEKLWIYPVSDIEIAKATAYFTGLDVHNKLKKHDGVLADISV